MYAKPGTSGRRPSGRRHMHQPSARRRVSQTTRLPDSRLPDAVNVRCLSARRGLPDSRLPDAIIQTTVCQTPSARSCLPSATSVRRCLLDAASVRQPYARRCLPDSIWQTAIGQTASARHHICQTPSARQPSARHRLPDAVWLPDLPDDVSFYVAIGLSTRVKPGNAARLNSCVF